VVPPDATKCPVCGIEFEDDEDEKALEEDKGEEGEEDLEEEDEDEGEEAEEDVEEEDIRKVPHILRDRILFYAGIVLIMAGGPGLAFGSWLHDVLGIPLVGDTYAAFGWINVMFAITGGVVLIIGVILLVLSLRGGILSQDDFEKLKAEGLT
jgi:uncharacterized membrane protein YcjF (UPF0283 family)